MPLSQTIMKFSKYYFNKFIYKHTIATTISAYNALDKNLDEAFKTNLQNDTKIAKLLLSLGKLDLNYQDSEGNSILMNILKSGNISI